MSREAALRRRRAGRGARPPAGEGLARAHAPQPRGASGCAQGARVAASACRAARAARSRRLAQHFSARTAVGSPGPAV
ncbi:Hypothetical predicted protein [Marmota monax]|uniref:Uncharacterized protein n=1 Tax=Marmota monax TaxID=9995 RepID=A0A5E4A7H0_MARMO|nr:Hypothetical predicted protein [Marmota monax]